MPSRYQYGIEKLNERRPNYPVFNDVESILNQLQKYWLLREQFRRRGHRGIRRKMRTPSPSHFTPNDRGKIGPLARLQGRPITAREIEDLFSNPLRL